MNIKTVFTSKQSIFVIIGLAILVLFLLIIIQKEKSDIEAESIKREIHIKEVTERLLFDLRETLLSDADNESKKIQSLSIISKIRGELNKDTIYLRLEAQQNIAIINSRIDTIEQYVINEQFEQAVKEVDELILDLKDSTDLEQSFTQNHNNTNPGNSSSPTGEKNNYNPNFSNNGENTNTSGNTTETNNTSGNTNNTGGGTTTTTPPTNTGDQTTTPSPTLKKGTTPSWDRNKKENVSEDYVELKIGN